MSSPNEPGYPRAAEGGANGSGSGPAPEGGSPSGAAPARGPQPSGPGPERIADPADVPPWQRGRAPKPANRGPEGPARPETPRRGNGGPTAHSPGMDARLNRFLSGGTAQEQDAAGRADPPESPRPEGPARPEGPRGDQPPRPEPPARAEQPARPEPPTRAEPRPETPARPEYASEIPDLSGPPRTPARKPTERSGQEPAGRPGGPGGRLQVGTRHQGPVRASMQIRRVDPWSVLKVSAVLSVALFFVWMIAVAFLYLVLGGMGVWSKLNSNVGDLLTSASGTSGGELVSSGTIFGGAALIGLVNIVLLTAMATVGAFIYNLTTDIVGGVEVTLADRD
ncbi:hypothetical protein BST36_11395 [Mycolicibacterium moriokaense]|uniref:DUF3566 domain-containing protein n=1 Tax=Mycolicibacterium moriokaense TaxID=39691 RepID=A0AAD1M4P6_9MYCO|nr:DUF3566 domain-containing protein [Mycolicibacterium moriokaense]MCV7037538.1 DUF3566 domain-containing protein [Mycolicibacterium moriokaense]ORB23602.1 hypothetical protein BST36_11395 [Mycolicibacterium moriokaense]BBW99523.1 hypothetical protein MMOR_04600 [Mycolicibacterium moriokaense]